MLGGNPRNAFERFHSAVTFFPDRPEVPEIQKEMTEAFVSLYVGPAADKLPQWERDAIFDDAEGAAIQRQVGRVGGRLAIRGTNNNSHERRRKDERRADTGQRTKRRGRSAGPLKAERSCFGARSKARSVVEPIDGDHSADRFGAPQC